MFVLKIANLSAWSELEVHWHRLFRTSWVVGQCCVLSSLCQLREIVASCS